MVGFMSRFVLALLLVTVTICPVLLAPAKDAPSDGPGRLRVTSFNIRYLNKNDGDNAWANRRGLLFDTVAKADPDLLGMQEVLHAQAVEIRDRLKDYDFVGVGRTDGKEAGEYSPILFKRDRFEKLGEGHLWLSPTPEVPGGKGWDAALPRIATWVKLRDRRSGGRELLYVNTHWDHKGALARQESGKLMRSALLEKSPDAAVVITGDFNCHEDGPAYANLVHPNGDPPPRLIDSYRDAHPKQTPDEATAHGFGGRRSGARIDYVFHTPHFATREASIDYTNDDGRYPSDHYPVHAVLTWKPAD